MPTVKRTGFLVAGLAVILVGSGISYFVIQRNNQFLFAAIGDYGIQKPSADQVAALVKSWNPDFIITLGDNSYRRNVSVLTDDNIGRLYSDYIYPYKGVYGSGSEDKTNRFWPALGDHDRDAGNYDDYLEYFTLPNNERYYDVRIGNVHLFALSVYLEPDGKREDSVQAEWFKGKIEVSDSPWKIVYLHHPPYGSGFRGGYSKVRWPFAKWGATAVLSGEFHNYERLEVDDIPYIVNGLGGNEIYEFGKIVEESIFRYNENHGAMKIHGNSREITFEFRNIDDMLIDSLTLTR